ncbi:MAG: NAD-dependent epimerase/dehydratase family protein [Deltaproteobacteria bacterium]|nr:NAD-dependent epimerase/dehydratase family protein [Deltaproteobacteria bacterium]
MNESTAQRTARQGGTKRVLVTGGAGFIGSHLVAALVGRGFEVRVLDNLSSGRRDYVDAGAELVEADVEDLSGFESAFAGVDCVFHLAAAARVLPSVEAPLRTHMANVVGTLNTLVAAREAGVPRFVYAGSSSVYGAQARLPLSEEMRPNPLSPYAVQKLAAEHYTRLFHQLYQMETLTLRYFNVYGPRMAEEGRYATVLGCFARAKRQGQPLVVHGDGEQTRDFAHVRDVVRANLAAMTAPVADGRALNVGSARSFSVNQVAAMVGGPTLRMPSRPGDVRHTLADLTRTRTSLGWQPEVDPEKGIAEFLREALKP